MQKPITLTASEASLVLEIAREAFALTLKNTIFTAAKQLIEKLEAEEKQQEEAVEKTHDYYV